MKKLNLNYYEFFIKLLLTIVVFVFLYFIGAVAYYGTNEKNIFSFVNVFSHILFILTVLVYTVLLKMIWKKK
jgi:hypothetical protein